MNTRESGAGEPGGELMAPQPDGDYRIDVLGCVREGWSLFRQEPVKFIGFSLLLLLILLPLQIPYQIASLPSAESSGAQLFLLWLISVAGSVLAIPLNAGLYVAAFRLMTGQTLAIRDFFRGFGYFWTLVFASILSGILVFLGSLLLILPGLYLSIGYGFAVFLIIDRRLGVWQALETSRKTVTKHWFTVFWLMIVLGCMNLIGFLMLGVGILVSMPVSCCALCVAYREIYGISRDAW